MCWASSLSWLVKPDSLGMSMLLFVESMLWSIISESDFVVSSVVRSAQALLSFHMPAGKLGSRPTGGGGPAAGDRAASPCHHGATADGRDRATCGIWVPLLRGLLSPLETPSPRRGLGARQRMGKADEFIPLS